jgi:DNA-binding MarR family transcriptional regulator
MGLDLALELHKLTSRLDRAADRILRAEQDVSYRRFLVLYMVDELDAPNQRTLADWLGVTEPSISRMTGTLSHEGLLTVARDEAGGNRRRLRLTPAGKDLARRIHEYAARGVW